MSPDTIGALIRAQAALGDRPLLVTDCAQITYADAERRSRAIASALLHSGVGRGSHVGMLYGNSLEFAVCFLGITRIGAVALPLATLSTAPEIRCMLRGADVEFLLAAASWNGRDLRQAVIDAIGTQSCEPLLLPELPTLRRVWFGVAELEEIPPTDDALVATAEAQVSPADTLVIVHTSGSTSAPKGVVHTHGQVIRNMQRQNALRRYTGDDRLFSNSPFFWIGGLAYSFLATLIAGARLICSSAAPAATLDLLEAQQPTMCNGVASTVLALARDPSFAKRDLNSLRRGNLYPIMPAAVRPADPELRSNLLGATETGSVSLWGDGDVDLPEHKRGTFGRPVPGIEARVVVAAATSNTVQDAEDGELWVRGPNVMQGYYGRERWQCFDAEGWFHTGDMMRVDRDGDFYFKGRGGDIIRTSGAQVSPREVEAAISEITGGRMSFVVGVPDPERGQVVTAVLVGDAPFDAEALKAALKQRLSAYKVPRRFLALADRELPTLSSGKVDLKQLVERVRER
jgi:acyl-CoA synthetase (AMP-forming)/AMP-acid ligase II